MRQPPSYPNITIAPPLIFRVPSHGQIPPPSPSSGPPHGPGPPHGRTKWSSIPSRKTRPAWAARAAWDGLAWNACQVAIHRPCWRPSNRATGIKHLQGWVHEIILLIKKLGQVWCMHRHQNKYRASWEWYSSDITGFNSDCLVSNQSPLQKGDYLDKS